MDKEFLDAIEAATDQFLKLAVNAEHRKLQEKLEQFATELGFPDKVPGGLDRRYPDVLREGIKYPRVLFVGDAKDAAHQRAKDSSEQFLNYLESIESRCQKGLIGALIVVATNDAGAAEEWKETLPELATGAKLKVGFIDSRQIKDFGFVVTMAARQ